MHDSNPFPEMEIEFPSFLLCKSEQKYVAHCCAVLRFLSFYIFEARNVIHYRYILNASELRKHF